MAQVDVARSTGPEVKNTLVCPKRESVRLIVTGLQSVRDDNAPGQVRELQPGTVILEGAAVYGFKALDKAIAAGKIRLEKV